MAEDWSAEEVALTVADYFAMLWHELRGEAYSKADHRRSLRPLLNKRSDAAIEFKHQNISAVLHEMGVASIDGYKPRSNYQELLKTEVAHRLEQDVALRLTLQAIVEAPAPQSQPPASLDDVIVPRPKAEKKRRIYERRSGGPPPRLGVNYLEMETRNRSLGFAGELFAVEVEQRRLWMAGLKKLSERVEHVSMTRGDGLGYDILSFEPSGLERFIEVKTTNFGQMTPFFASRGEVALSEDNAAQFSLYRVFAFRDMPKLFMLDGSLRESCDLEPAQFRASPR